MDVIHEQRTASALKSWLLAAVLAGLVIALVAPTGQLRSTHDWTTAVANVLHEIPTLLLYLVGIASLTLAIGTLGAWSISRGGALGGVVRVIAQPLAMMGLSPVQPAVAAVLSTTLLLINFRHGPVLGLDLRTANYSLVIGVIVVILFAITLGPELALRISEETRISELNRVGTLIQEVAPALGGRLAAQVFTAVLFTVVITREIGQKPQLPQPADGVLVAVVATILAWLIWSGGRALQRGAANQSEASLILSPPGSLVYRGLAWLLLAVALVGPLVLAKSAGNPLKVSFASSLHAPSGLVPFSSNWGADSLGHSERAVLLSAWWNDVRLGGLAGLGAMAIGLIWRAAKVRLPHAVGRTVESVMTFMPPVVLFYAIWGGMVAIRPQPVDLTSIAIAIAVVLTPQAMRLARYPQSRLPVVTGVLVVLGTLLMFGWQLIIGPSFISPSVPSFAGAFSEAQIDFAAAPWLLWSTIEVMAALLVLNVVVLAALVTAYRLPRPATRLRG